MLQRVQLQTDHPEESSARKCHPVESSATDKYHPLERSDQLEEVTL